MSAATSMLIGLTLALVIQGIIRLAAPAGAPAASVRCAAFPEDVRRFARVEDCAPAVNVVLPPFLQRLVVSVLVTYLAG